MTVKQMGAVIAAVHLAIAMIERFTPTNIGDAFISDLCAARDALMQGFSTEQSNHFRDLSKRNVELFRLTVLNEFRKQVEDKARENARPTFALLNQNDEVQ